jgi:hypothetical protein
VFVPATPEEFAFELSKETFEAQRQTEVKLRERATTILSASSVVVPVAAVGLGKGPTGTLIAFACAAVFYVICANYCLKPLFPKDFRTGIEGGSFLGQAAESGANLAQMQGTAAAYLDTLHAENQPTLENAADDVKKAIEWLTLEIFAVAVALAITIIG